MFNFTITEKAEITKMYYKHLSNGAMYDPLRGLYIHFLPDLPHPQNRKQISLDRLSVQLIRSLADDELDYLRSEVRRLIHLPIKSCKEERWYKENNSRILLEYRRRQLQHEYYWSDYCHRFRMEFWSWMKKFKPNQYHAFNGLQYLPKQQKAKWSAFRKQLKQKDREEKYDWLQ